MTILAPIDFTTLTSPFRDGLIDAALMTWYSVFLANVTDRPGHSVRVNQSSSEPTSGRATATAPLPPLSRLRTTTSRRYGCSGNSGDRRCLMLQTTVCP